MMSMRANAIDSPLRHNLIEERNLSGFKTTKHAYEGDGTLKTQRKLAAPTFPSMVLERSNVASSELRNTIQQSSPARVPKLLLSQTNQFDKTQTTQKQKGKGVSTQLTSLESPSVILNGHNQLMPNNLVVASQENPATNNFYSARHNKDELTFSHEQNKMERLKLHLSERQTAAENPVTSPTKANEENIDTVNAKQDQE